MKIELGEDLVISVKAVVLLFALLTTFWLGYLANSDAFHRCPEGETCRLVRCTEWTHNDEGAWCVTWAPLK